MEVEHVSPITTHGVSAIATQVSDNVISSIIMEEKELHNNGEDVAMILNKEELNMECTNGDDKRTVESDTPICRSASSPTNRRQAKKRGAFSLFRAVFMSFSGSNSVKKRDAASDRKKADGKPAAATAAAALSSNEATWKNLVDGMRPLRLHGQLEYYPPPPPLGHDVYHDVLLPPPSPVAWQGEGMTSRYASAQDLQLLDNEEEKEESAPAAGGDVGCPHAIDRQAEEFIAKFYEQFRLQMSDSFNNRAE